MASANTVIEVATSASPCQNMADELGSSFRSSATSARISTDYTPKTSVDHGDANGLDVAHNKTHMALTPHRLHSAHRNFDVGASVSQSDDAVAATGYQIFHMNILTLKTNKNLISRARQQCSKETKRTGNPIKFNREKLKVQKVEVKSWLRP